MEIKSTLVNRSGQTLPITYRDIESLDEIKDRKVDAVRAYCFCGNDLVIVYSDTKGYWTPPGGGVELGETVEEAAVREVLEETNMRVIEQIPIGTLEVFEPEQTKFQVRLICIVEPVGPFVADTDPEGDITEIKLIDPNDIKQYFDWGEVGDYVLARALELRGSF